MDSDPQPRRFSPAVFYGEIKRRNVRERFAIYLSAALTILGVTNLFSGVYHLPAVLFDAVLVVLLCGLPCALVSAWFHGAEGTQRFRVSEVSVYALCLVAASALVGGHYDRALPLYSDACTRAGAVSASSAKLAFAHARR